MTSKPSFTDTQAGAQITRDDYQWGTALGTSPGTITFGFRTSGATYTSDGQTFTPFSPSEQTAAETALALWSSIANISFQNLGSTNNATIEFSNYRSSTDGAEAYTYFPGNTAASSPSGDVFVNTQYASTTNDSPDTYEFLTFIHEIGHSLGLEHPGDYDANPGQTITYANDAEYVQDSHQYTVMSYFDETNTGANFKGNEPQTPMMDDIVAIQRLYGANTTTRTGDTTYGFNTTSDISSNAAFNSIYNFAINKTPVYCIYDAGGINTLDCSGYAGAQTINLGSGTFSSVMGLIDNVSIAPGTSIQIGIGGSGNDTLITGAAGDTMTGGAGADIFKGTGANFSSDIITDFSLTDSIDVTDVAYLASADGYSGTATAGEYQITIGDSHGSTSFDVFGALSTDSLVFASDGNGGTRITLSTTPPTGPTDPTPPDPTPPTPPTPPTTGLAAPALTAASDTGLSSTDGITRDTTPTFSGVAEAGAFVILYDGTKKVGSTTADATTGAYTITSTAVRAGSHAFHVAETADGVTTSSSSTTVVVDTTAPLRPRAPMLTAQSDTGVSSHDKITTDPTPTVTGYAEAGSTINLIDGQTVVGTATADSSGSYTITASVLADGTHALKVQSTDIAGNTSTSGVATIRIDTQAPSGTITSTGNATSTPQQTITGTGEVGAKVTLTDNGITVGTVTIGARGTWSDKIHLVSGTNDIAANYSDKAGNVSSSDPVAFSYTPASTGTTSHLDQNVANLTHALFEGAFGGGIDFTASLLARAETAHTALAANDTFGIRHAE